MTCVSMGNPHLVLFCRDVVEVPLYDRRAAAGTGRRISQADQRPFRASPSADEVTMRTWERGSGITLACGTGASAVCVAGVLAGRTGAPHPGPLARRRLGTGVARRRSVMMTGPAVEVFSGEWPDDDAVTTL